MGSGHSGLEQEGGVNLGEEKFHAGGDSPLQGWGPCGVRGRPHEMAAL